MARKKKVTDIDAKLEEVKAKIKSNSKDAHFADTLIDELVSLKGQKNHQPMYLSIPEKDVIKTYDYDSFSISNCKGGILFHAKGGYDAYVTPRMKALYEHLALIIDMKERYDELSEEDKENYNSLFSATTMILQIPIFATITPKCFFGIASEALIRLDEATKELLKQPLGEDNPFANAEFDNMVAATEELKKMGKDE